MAQLRAEQAKRMGKPKTVPEAAIRRMMGTFELPVLDEGFDKVLIVDNLELLKRVVGNRM
jgi:hypothetical protein